MKVCTQCSLRKPLTEFYHTYSRCKTCRKEYILRQKTAKIGQRTAARIRMAFFREGITKHPYPRDLIHCTYEHLANHLGDIGDKEIDHIIPLSRYNLHDPIDLQHAFHWQNTQLLTREENNSKGNKLPSHDTLQSLKHLWPNSWWHPDCDQYFTGSSIAY